MPCISSLESMTLQGAIQAMPWLVRYRIWSVPPLTTASLMPSAWGFVWSVFQWLMFSSYYYFADILPLEFFMLLSIFPREMGDNKANVFFSLFPKFFYFFGSGDPYIWVLMSNSWIFKVIWNVDTFMFQLKRLVFQSYWEGPDISKKFTLLTW